MRTGLMAAASLAALAIASTAQAAEEGQVELAAAMVQELTVIGTRTEKRESEVPASVSVITDIEIQDQLATDIKDLVRYEPGVSVRSSPARFGAALGTTGRDGNSGFNIRGLEGNRVLIQVDGIRTPDGFVFGAQSVGRGDYGDLDLVKQVEILRGPASALYGSDGVAGAVSFTTKDPSDFLDEGASVGGQLKGAYASADDSWTGGLVAAMRQGSWSGMVAYSHRRGDAQETQGKNASANSDRTKANPSDVRSDSVLAKLVFEPSDAHRFRLTGEWFQRDVETDVLSGRAKPPLAATSVIGLLADDQTERKRVSLDHAWAGEGAFERLTWTAYWQESRTVQFTAEDRNTAADRIRLNTFDNEVWGASAEVHGRLETGGVIHRLVWGGDISKTRQEGLRDGTVPPAGEVFPTRAFPNTDYTLGGAFIQDEIALFGGRLTLFPALRWDGFELDPKRDAALPAFTPSKLSDSHISPKLGVLFQPGERLGFFLNYAEGFKAPAPSQVNNVFVNPIQNYVSLANPDLKPETSQTIEGGVRWSDERMFLSLTGFAGEYDDFIEQVQVAGAFTPTNPAVFQTINLTGVKLKGIEAKARVELPKGFGLNAAASLARGDVVTTGKFPLDSIDPFKLVVGLSWRDGEGRFGGEVVATHSAGKDAARVAQACTPSCFLPEGFTVVDATAFWNVTEEIKLRAGVFNIGDQKYWWWNDVRGLSSTAVSRDAYSQPGRNFAVSLTLRL